MIAREKETLTNNSSDLVTSDQLIESYKRLKTCKNQNKTTQDDENDDISNKSDNSLSLVNLVNINGSKNNNNINNQVNNLFNNNTRTRANPFKLIPCEKYLSDDQAPFNVRLSIEALLIIDIHAHSLTTEVIGLLGGIYCKQTCQLFILTAEPCLTIDDHNLQCEMEPVSQAMASERLESKGYQVVGWYHSHPTFVPNPSLRDLETQSRYQRLFSLENEKPFIALILSPYSTLNQPASKNTLVSKYKVITLVGDESHNNQSNCCYVDSVSSSECHNCPSQSQRAPYELTTQLIRREKLMFSVTEKIKELLPKIVEKATAVSMLDKIRKFRSGEVTYLQKLLASLKYYLEQTTISQVEINFFLDQIQTIIEDNNNQTTKGKKRLLNNNNSNNNNHR